MSTAATYLPSSRRLGGLSNPTLARFLRHKLAVLGVAMIILLVLACVFGPWLLHYDDLAIDIRNRFCATTDRQPLPRHRRLGP